MTAELSVQLAEATLYANDTLSETVEEFKNGTITLGIDDIGPTVAGDLIGTVVDSNNVIISSEEDVAPPVTIGFRAKRSNGKYRYFWLYRVKLGIPPTSVQTKGDSITFSTPSIEDTVMRRNKLNVQNKHPWKTEVTEGEEGVSASTISGWFTQVYEPDFETVNLGD